MGVPLQIAGFSGLAPRTHKRLLQPNQAQVAVNTRLTSGQIASLRDPSTVNTPSVVGIVSIFRALLNGAEKWLAWNVDVDVARGPIAADILGRLYWTGDNEPRMAQYSDYANGAGPYPSIFMVLGVFPPKTAPGVVPGGGAGVGSESRSYCYTFQTQLGEESQPSPVSAVQTANNAAWALSAMDIAPANTFATTAGAWAAGIATLTVASTFGLRVGEAITVAGVGPSGFNATNTPITAVTPTTVSYAVASNPGAYATPGTVTRIASHNTTGMVKNIYRTVTGTSGATDFRYVDSVPVATTTYNDVKTTAVVALNNLLPSVTYEQPPTDMRSLISLGNGMMAGISKNQVCLSYPFQPHAWPTGTRQTVSHNAVGLGYFGTTIVCVTEGPPYTMTGVDPLTMGGGMQALGVEWPGLSKRGIVSTPFGVLYPTPQGLAIIGVGGADIVTRPFYTQEEWTRVMPATFAAAMRDNKYYAAYTVDANFSYVLIIDRSEFAAVTIANYKCSELWTDLLSGKLYAVQADVIKEWDSLGGINSSYDWQSMEFVFPKPQNLGAAKVDADFSETADQVTAIIAAIAAAQAANQAIINGGFVGGAYGITMIGEVPIGGNLLGDVPEATYDQLQFQLYINGALKFSKTLTDSRAFRLPAGYEADNCSVRMAGNVPVSSIKLAPTMKALERV